VACQLAPYPADADDFKSATGAQVTLFVDSDSGTVRIIAATSNGAPVALNADGSVTFTTVAGLNIFDLAFVGADPSEVFRIKENCGDGTSQQLLTWRLEPTPIEPGGPARQIRIHAA